MSKRKLWLIPILILAAYAVAVFWASTSPLTTKTTRDAVAEQKPVIEPVTADGMYIALNNVRTSYSLAQFKRNPLLDKSAGAKCEDMINNKYYDHKSPITGKHGYTYVADTGVNSSYASENLNRGSFLNSGGVVDSWMNSDSHKASILDPRYTEIGFAVCGDPKTPTIVQHKIETARR